MNLKEGRDEHMAGDTGRKGRRKIIFHNVKIKIYMYIYILKVMLHLIPTVRWG